ncbi:MAG: amidase family protein [Pseudomonadales bacterium]|nr:amidase family protein [Pseudomonadales bacterium]
MARLIFRSISFILLLAFGQGLWAAEQWQRFDQSADLAALSALDNDSMHFRLLQSPVQDKNRLWQDHSAALSEMGAERYEALKPLILEADVPGLQRAVAAGQFSYTELATFYLYRLREIETDPQRYLNAVISINPQLLATSRQRDQARQEGLQTGRQIDSHSLFGIPVLLKDNIGFAGLPTTAGALALRENLSGNAFITAQLEQAGAVILGKANLSEWAYFFCEQCPSGYSAMGGQTLNPYGRLQFGTGGSSSGSGAAVAANLAAVTVGSETSGSILSPASSHSAVGLKPTTGALSRSGIVPISSSLDTAGPITRSVTDAVILFNAMAGYDQTDLAMPLISSDLQLQLREVDLQGRRLGALRSFVDDTNYQQALSVLSARGALIVETDMPEFDSEGFGQFLGAEMVRDLAAYLADYADAAVSIDSIAALQQFNNQDVDLRAPYGQALVDMMAGLQLSDEELAALRERLQSGARAALDQLFASQDIELLLSVNNRNAGIAALANYPALTLPMGFDDRGRPMGLTLLAPPFQEQLLIDIGLQFERHSQARRPPAAYQ